MTVDLTQVLLALITALAGIAVEILRRSRNDIKDVAATAATKLDEVHVAVNSRDTDMREMLKDANAKIAELSRQLMPLGGTLVSDVNQTVKIPEPLRAGP